MEISLERLTSIINEAYDLGSQGCAELKKQELQDLLAKHNIKDVNEFRLWTVDELNKLPTGTILSHILHRRGFINARANGRKFMQFERGQTFEFHSNLAPWDKPMRLLHKE